MKKLGCAFVVFVFLLACASSGFAQSHTTTGTVQGDVLDERGGSVAGATVEARNRDTNFTQTEKTNSDGHFAFLSLAPGHYQLTISQPGFASVLQQNVNLTVGQAITIPVTMKISSVSQQIVVTDVPVIETTKTENSATLDELAVADTPVLGRKFEDLLTLTPGVSISQGPDGDEININGQRGIFNNISLDGGDYNNGFFGEQMDGQPLDGFRRNQFGGSLGGPLVKDKLFFFAAGEGIRENLNRAALGAPLGTACGVSNPVFNSNITDAQIATSGDYQRQVLL